MVWYKLLKILPNIGVHPADVMATTIPCYVGNHLDVQVEVRIKGSDQWVITLIHPIYK